MQLYNWKKKRVFFFWELGHQNYRVRVKFRDKPDGALHFQIWALYRVEKWTQSQNILSPFHQDTFIKGYFELNTQYEVDFQMFLVFLMLFGHLTRAVGPGNKSENNDPTNRQILGKVVYRLVLSIAEERIKTYISTKSMKQLNSEKSRNWSFWGDHWVFCIELIQYKLNQIDKSSVSLENLKSKGGWISYSFVHFRPDRSERYRSDHF